MNRGFTLLEAVVTIGIAAMISSLVLANFPKFSRQLELSRTSQAVATSFREAEGFALGVREFNGLFPAYGLHFSSADKKQYVLFADLPDVNGNTNHVYDLTDANEDGKPDELVDTYTISLIPSLKGFCVGKKSGGARCYSDADIGTLDAVFVRPNPDIFISINGTRCEGITCYSDAEIFLELPTGECREVVIWQTGQLSIEPIESPCTFAL